MAALLPLVVVLLLGSAAPCLASFNKDLQEVCEGYTTPKSVQELFQCPEPPCNTTTAITTLPLPLQLSLDTASRSWTADLQLYNTTGIECGLVVLSQKTQNTVDLQGAVCGEDPHNHTVSHTPASEDGGWVHLEVVGEGQQVKLYLQGHKDTPFTLTCQDHPPYKVVVVPDGLQYGYSVLNNNNNSQILYIVFGILGAVVVVVVMVVWYIIKTRRTHGVATTPAIPLARPVSRHESINSLYGRLT